MRKSLAILAAILLAACSQELRVTHTTCEYAEEPLGVEAEHPLLGWRLQGAPRGRQQSYELLVADSPRALEADEGNCWQTGVVNSPASQNIAYEGTPLQPRRTYYWKVRVRDAEGRLSAWSKTSSWRQGSMADGQRKWIGLQVAGDGRDRSTSLWYRRAFQIERRPAQRVYAEVSTPGFYELYLNGKRVGSEVLSPAVTGKDRRTFYVTHDVTDLLINGRNVVALWVGRGWSGPGVVPLHFSMELPQENGATQLIESDESWRVACSHYVTTSPWEWANFGGECVDAARAQEEWNSLQYDDSCWPLATRVDSPSPSIEAQNCEANRCTQRYTAPRIAKMSPLHTSLDFGCNMAGWVQLHLRGLAKGDTARIYYADRKWDSLVADTTPAGIVHGTGWDRVFPCADGAERYQIHNQMDLLIGSGRGDDEFRSRFNYHGFRHVIVEGDCTVSPDAVACLIESDLARVGSFSCSDTLLNRMHQVNDQTLRSLNLGGVYVDCPTRERLGYGDGQVSVESSIMNYHMPRFYRKFVRDWLLRQDSTGALPHVAPNSQGGGGLGWPGLVAAIAWRNYLYYGDLPLLRSAYVPMMRYLQYIERETADGIYYGPDGNWDSIGDWLAPDRGMDTNRWPPKEWNDFFNNCYRVLLWRLQLVSAQALGRSNDAERCAQKIAEILPLIHRRFYNEATGLYLCDEQSYLLMPLVAGVVPPELEETIKRRLLAKLEEQGCIGTGMLGTYFLIHYLQAQGENELLYRLVAHQRYPGWGYMLSQGATTWWEQWNGYWSQIHSCFTSLDSWFYQGICGIRPCSESPGMQHFEVAPAFIPQLGYAKAATQSLYGTIASEWQRHGHSVTLHVTVPCNSRATLRLPHGYGIVQRGSSLSTLELEPGRHTFKCVPQNESTKK